MAANGYDDDQTRSFTALAAGTRISHYTIVSKIGAGGMGEVYLAEDTELHRKVALKFLPVHLCQDDDCRKRFKREAQAAAKLDHPHIVPVYEVGEYQGRPFFAMGYIEGRSLREVIREGKLTVEQAIAYTKQICEGLDKAHESGVVHRDIKPGNVIIDTGDRVRIVDFGLATVSGEEKLTKTGSTLGTVGYMSPEQIEGKKVDHRSDLFSVGVMLYEMLTGRRPFEGDTDAAVGRAITDATPEPIARYKSGTTGELQQIINKALQKDPSLRYQHADGMLADLKRLEIGIPAGRKQRKRAIVWTVVSLTIVGAALGYFLTRDSVEPQRDPIRRRQVTFFGDVHTGALSPDGRYLAIVRGTYGGISKPVTADSMRVFVLDLDGGEPVKVFTDWWIAGVWWTPDGRELLVRADNAVQGGFYKMPRFGGEPRLYPVEGLGTYWRVTWAADGIQFAAASDFWRDTYFVVNAATGATTPVTLDGDFDWIFEISWIPGTDDLYLIVNNEDGNRGVVVPVKGGKMQEIGRGQKTSLHWTADGEFLRYRNWNGDLMSIGFDKDAKQWLDEPELLVPDVASAPSSAALDSSGRTLCFVEKTDWSNIRIVDLDERGRISENHTEITSGTARHLCPALSSDGKYAVYTKLIESSREVYILDLETNRSRRISYASGYSFGGAWSPDDARIAYAAYVDGVDKLAIFDVATGVSKICDSCVVNANNQTHSPVYWAPSDRILYELPGARGVMSFDPETEELAHVGPAPTEDAWMFVPIGSPATDSFVMFWNHRQGRANYLDESSVKSGIWISSYAGNDAKLLVPLAIPAGWSHDGEWVYAWRIKDEVLLKVSTVSAAVDTLGVLPDAHMIGLAVAPEAGRVIYTHWESRSDLWLIENLPQGKR